MWFLHLTVFKYLVASHVTEPGSLLTEPCGVIKFSNFSSPPPPPVHVCYNYFLIPLWRLGACIATYSPRKAALTCSWWYRFNCVDNSASNMTWLDCYHLNDQGKLEIDNVFCVRDRGWMLHRPPVGADGSALCAERPATPLVRYGASNHGSWIKSVVNSYIMALVNASSAQIQSMFFILYPPCIRHEYGPSKAVFVHG